MKPNIFSNDRAIHELRSLVVGTRIPDGAIPPRVGRVILIDRPVIRVRGGALLNSEDQVADDPAQLLRGGLKNAFGAHAGRLKEIAEEFSTSTGRIDVKDASNTWIPVGTGFLTKGDGEVGRMLTAGHVAASFLARDAIPILPRQRWTTPEYGPDNGLGDVRIVFEDDPDGGAVGLAITKLVWTHGRWDLALCEVQLDQPRPSLPIETHVDWADSDREPLAVFGYPIDGGHLPSQVTEDPLSSFLTDYLETKCICPGLATNAANSWGPMAQSLTTLQGDLRHEATTFGGNSGSPVFSVRTGKVVGLHYAGGAFEAGGIGPNPDDISANRCLHLPLALGEDRLRQEVLNEGDPDDRAPEVFGPNLISWSKFTIGSDDELEAMPVATQDTQLPPTLINAVLPDRPDDRDLEYQPGLLPMPSEVIPPRDANRLILNQRAAPACAAFALAAAINQQNRARNPDAPPVSTRMLFEFGKAHDEWIDDSAMGSSIRGVLKGFDHSGVCSAASAPFFASREWVLTRQAAREATNVTLAAYLRVAPKLNDFQVAINEIGSVLVSARIHNGWIRPSSRRIGKIPISRKIIGNHAFVIIGYDREGFIVQNSWGADWAAWKDRPGLAHWSYADWAQNLLDAWVFRLAANTPDGLDLMPRVGTPKGADAAEHLPRPRRHSLIGHVVHAESDRVIENGRFGLGIAPLVEAAAEVALDEDLQDIAFVYHDPFFATDLSLRIAGHLTPGFLANRICPLHILYGVDEMETYKSRLERDADVIRNRFAKDPIGKWRYFSRRAAALLGPALGRFEDGASKAAQRGGALWCATAPFAIDAVRRHRITMIAIGSGCFAADAQYRAMAEDAKQPIAQLIRIGCPTGLATLERAEYTPPIMEVRLSELIGSEDFGEWADLAAAARQAIATGRAFSGDATRELHSGASTLREAVTSAQVLNSIVSEITGRRPSPTRRFQPLH